VQIAGSIAELRVLRRKFATASVGFVPTMGALHAGHLSLTGVARAQNDRTIASIFVNPLQFGPNEDLAKYPRTFQQDCAVLREAGVDLLFAPTPDEMYPLGFAATVDAGPVAQRLDGASRPGHFTGVATVVTKLFNIVTPTRAYFGQKDAAQIAVLRQVVRDLSIPVELVVCPTVHEPDGLALSSRNRYLSPQERRQALVLSRALLAAEDIAEHGELDAAIYLEVAHAVLAQESALRLDYLALVNPDTLESLPTLEYEQPALLAVAGWIGATRLIDNTLLHVFSSSPSWSPK
jgi:pantoate--beta-alanine ligase